MPGAGGAARGRLSVEAVVAAARGMLEEHGRDAVAMRPLARRLGVRAPSLYQYVEGLEDLFDLLRRAARAELEAELAAVGEEEPGARAIAAGEAYVGWALSHPALFVLLFEPAAGEIEGLTPDPAAALIHGAAALAIARGTPPAASASVLNKHFKDVIQAMARHGDTGVMGLGSSLTVLQSLDIVKSAAG